MQGGRIDHEAKCRVIGMLTVMYNLPEVIKWTIAQSGARSFPSRTMALWMNIPGMFHYWNPLAANFLVRRLNETTRFQKQHDKLMFLRSALSTGRPALRGIRPTLMDIAPSYLDVQDLKWDIIVYRIDI